MGTIWEMAREEERYYPWNKSPQRKPRSINEHGAFTYGYDIVGPEERHILGNLEIKVGSGETNKKRAHETNWFIMMLAFIWRKYSLRL